MPYSSSHVALDLAGRGVAWAGKTYVVPEPGLSMELPGFIDATRSAGTAATDRWGGLCLRCFHQRSVTCACACD